MTAGLPSVLSRGATDTATKSKPANAAEAPASAARNSREAVEITISLTVPAYGYSTAASHAADQEPAGQEAQDTKRYPHLANGYAGSSLEQTLPDSARA